MSVRNQDESRFGLISALVVSVLAHLLAVLVILLVPWSTESKAVEPETREIKFTFEQPPPPPEPVPDESPTVPPDVPDLQPTPEPERQPEIAQPDSPEPTPFVEDTADPDQGLGSGFDLDSPAGPATDDSIPVDQLFTEIPPTPIPEPETEDLPGLEGPVESTFDLERALSEFRPGPLRPVDRARRASTSGGAGMPAGRLEYASQDYNLDDYTRIIQMILYEAFNRRLSQNTEHFRRWAYENRQAVLESSRRTTFSFSVSQQGNVSQVRLQESSGCAPLDTVFLDALAEVVFPPLPDDFPREEEAFNGLRWGFQGAVYLLPDGRNRPKALLVPR